MDVSEVMTRQVISASPDASIAQIARLMLRHRISGVPIMNAGGGIAGIVTEGDLLRRIETGTERHRSSWLEFIIGPGRLAQEYSQSHARKVAEVMTRDVISVGADAPLEEVVALLERHRINRLPVIDNGRLVGIVSRADLLRALAKALAKPSAAPFSDKAIQKRIWAELDKGRWAPRTNITVGVSRGVVTLEGVVTDERERQALCVLAENVPGVKKVRDELIWVDPFSGAMIGPVNNVSLK